MLTRLTLLASILALCLLAFTVPVSADIAIGIGPDFPVTRGDDPPPDGCLPTDCSLREAILAANSNPDFNNIPIQISSGIELSIAGADEDLAATGDLDILYPTAIGGGLNTVDANGIDRVFDIRPAPSTAGMARTPDGSDVQFAALLVTGGNVDITNEGGVVAGGGIRVGAGRLLAMALVTVHHNAGSGGIFGLGGGVGNEGGTVFLADSSVIQNSADNAAGIANVDGTMFLWDSTISTNTAAGAIGGILNLSNSAGVTATLTLDSVTIANNIEQAPSGSGAGLDTTSFDGNARTLIENSIVANNIGDTQCFAGGTGKGGVLVSLGYNLASDASCLFTGTADLNDTDPILGPLTSEADYTYYHPLLAASPAIDSGNTEGTQDQLGTTRPTDLPGYPNTVDGDDRGAFELVTVPTAVSLSSFTLTETTTSLPLMLLTLSTICAGVVFIKRRHR